MSLFEINAILLFKFILRSIKYLNNLIFIWDMDYEKIGFKSGLEIHQQLDGLKLFCSCPTWNSAKDQDIKVTRRLRAVAGETGKIDVAAKHEMQKHKQFIYVSNSEDTCLVEYDDEPPRIINQNALNTALQVALLLNAKIIDEIQVMRKTVVDGSNTSGFQRTALVARDGYINTSFGKVRIPVICLEEEAAQKLKEDDTSITYKLDRLGIPLIEIATDTDIINPEHAKEVASYLGMVLRSTGACKRGIGTIRQDVNISIKGGARTEIKGFQDLKSIVKVSENEVQRQLSLIKNRKKISKEVRKAEPDFTTSFLRPMPGAARMYPETDVAPIKITKERLSTIKVPELLSDKLKDLQKKYTIGEEKIKNLMKIAVFDENHFDLFEKLADQCKKVKPAFICETLLSYNSEILKKHIGSDPLRITKDQMIQIFEKLDNGKITKDSVLEILSEISSGKGLNIKKFEIEEIDLEKEIKQIIDQKKGLNEGAYMGLIMAKFKGKIDGKKAVLILKKYT
ncbi:MAG: Glu-tRNA(Gln) amidotransferase subunit GatE [Nanoarchaeota archaeon]